MLAKARSAGGAAYCELEGHLVCSALRASSPLCRSNSQLGHLVCSALCASSPVCRSNSQLSSRRSSRRHKQRLRVTLPKRLPFTTGRHSDVALLLCSAKGSSLFHRKIAGIGRCKARDGFLEGADGEATANDCVEPGNGIHQREELSVLWNLTQEIEPLDASRVSEDVSSDSKDAMKRTISGMLGLLPSDRFQVTIETTHGEIEKLLISSVMTGYTLRNAEYRVCLQRSLGLPDAGYEASMVQDYKTEMLDSVEELQDVKLADEDLIQELFDGNLSSEQDSVLLSPALEQYIGRLKSKLLAATKELESYEKTAASLGMNSMVGEEKNDLLDYLRSLDEEKVSELSCSSSPEVEEIVRQAVSRCLKVLAAANCAMEVEFSTRKSICGGEDTQAALMISRDYLARLLFWCMLFGHHLRGLEYRVELSHTLRLWGC